MANLTGNLKDSMTATFPREFDIPNPMTIQEIGTISPDEYFGAIDKMADAALADACTTTNPRIPTKEDIMKIYKKLWSF